MFAGIVGAVVFIATQQQSVKPVVVPIIPTIFVASTEERMKTLISLDRDKSQTNELRTAEIRLLELESGIKVLIDMRTYRSKIGDDFAMVLRHIKQNPGPNSIDMSTLDPATRRSFVRLLLRSPSGGPVNAYRASKDSGMIGLTPFFKISYSVGDEVRELSFDDVGDVFKKICTTETTQQELEAELKSDKEGGSEIAELQRELVPTRAIFDVRGSMESIDSEVELISKVAAKLKDLADEERQHLKQLEQEALAKYIKSMGLDKWPIDANTKFADLPEAFKSYLAAGLQAQLGPNVRRGEAASILAKSRISVSRSGYIISTGHRSKGTGFVQGNSFDAIRF